MVVAVIMILMIFEAKSEDETKKIGERIGALLKGGEIIELIGDVGSGKTTLTKGIALGLGVSGNIQSPSFTIGRLYSGKNDLSLAHYDFYRLSDAGIMLDEINETIKDKKAVTVIEWGEIIGKILPADRISITLEAISESARRLTVEGGKKFLRALS